MDGKQQTPLQDSAEMLHDSKSRAGKGKPHPNGRIPTDDCEFQLFMYLKP